MSPLGHLLCGCLGLAGLAAFMGVISLMINMLFEQSASWDLYTLIRIFGC